MEEKIQVSVVNYLNSKPFIYGLEHHNLPKTFHLSLDIPSACAHKLLNNEADIGLVPVAVIPQLNNFQIIGNTCIGSTGKVASVLLCSDVPLEQIEHIFLDFHSRTSVALVQVLSRHFWKIKPSFNHAPEDYINHIQNKTAGVIIGDRTFNLPQDFKYSYDLSDEWFKFTGLPFVFAAWVARKDLPISCIESFENALQYGLLNKQIVINQEQLNYGNTYDVGHYLNHNIQYHLDEEKRLGLNLFFEYLKELS